MATPEITATPRHPLLRLRLFIMMFLQFGIWGAWYSVLSDYLSGQGFTGTQTSWIYALLPLACMIGSTSNRNPCPSVDGLNQAPVIPWLIAVVPLAVFDFSPPVSATGRGSLLHAEVTKSNTAPTKTM